MSRLKESVSHVCPKCEIQGATERERERERLCREKEEGVSSGEGEGVWAVMKGSHYWETPNTQPVNLKRAHTQSLNSAIKPKQCDLFSCQILFLEVYVTTVKHLCTTMGANTLIK